MLGLPEGLALKLGSKLGVADSEGDQLGLPEGSVDGSELGIDDKLGSIDTEGTELGSFDRDGKELGSKLGDELIEGALLRVGRRDGLLDDEGNDVGCSVFPFPFPDFVGLVVGMLLGSELGSFDLDGVPLGM